MTEAIWYFADGDEERGPVTEAQVRTLIGTGNLKPDDLVWKEGMDDWAAAEEVPGLFEKEPPAPPVESSADETEAEEEPAEKEEPVKESKAPAVKRPRRPMPSLDVSKPIEVFEIASFLGQPLFLAGLLLVLLSRGCDSLGDRYVARVAAKSKVVEDQFQDRWDRERAPIDSRRRELADKPNPTREDGDELTALEDKLRELDEDKQDEREELRRGEWKSRASAARDAASNNDMWAYWREGFFWFGTFIFSLGLMVVGFTEKRAERRWMCLIILAVVVYALYTVRS